MPSLPHAPRASAAINAVVRARRGRTAGGIILFDPVLAPTPDQLRQAMALAPTAVTIVTAAQSGAPAGATANAVTSLSLDPPLMLACLDRGSRTLEVVRATGAFGVSVLGAGQEGLARGFASKAPHTEKFREVAMDRARGCTDPRRGDRLGCLHACAPCTRAAITRSRSATPSPSAARVATPSCSGAAATGRSTEAGARPGPAAGAPDTRRRGRAWRPRPDSACTPLRAREPADLTDLTACWLVRAITLVTNHRPRSRGL